MSRPPRLRWEIVLSHSLPENLHRCIRVPVRGGFIHLCTRCLGLYPALVVGLVARLTFATPEAHSSSPLVGLDLIIRLIIPFIGAAAWGVEQIGIELSKASRLTSGAFIGVGVGWVLGLHVRQPWPDELIELSLAMGVALLLGMLGRWTRATEEAEAIDVEPQRKEKNGRSERK